jgi:glycosyltransferase involved in cell wall biosynthesis
MIIAVNTRCLIEGRMDGIAWYTKEIFERIVRAHPEHRFLFLFDRPYSETFIFADNITPLVIPPPARHPVLWYLWYEWMLPRVLKRHNVDLFVSPDNLQSLRTSVPTTVVIHDLSFEHFPMDVPWATRRYYTSRIRKGAHHARSIVTVSEASRDDIVDTYNVDTSKIFVAPPAVRETLTPTPPAEQGEVKKRWAQGEDYFIILGTVQPRKNHERMFAAFEAFKRQTQSPMKLVIVGHKGWQNEGIHQALQAMEFREDVITTGKVDHSELSALLGSATACLFASTFEGFGMPIIEAQHVGVPAITSNVSSMPEAAGDAALLVDPFSVESITEAMMRITSDPDLRQHLITRGYDNVRRFSWDHSASVVWDAMMRSVSHV